MTTLNRARDSVSPDNDPHSLDTLIRNLRSYLGHSSGISSYEVQVEKLKALLDAYEPQKDDWRKYGQADPSKAYVRLLVDSINGRSNLVRVSQSLGPYPQLTTSALSCFSSGTHAGNRPSTTTPTRIAS